MKPNEMMRAVLLAVPAALVVASAAGAGEGLPVKFGQITSGRGWRVDPFGSGKMAYHKGIDIAVPTGTPVFPTALGTVIFAGYRSAHGNTVIVRHPDGSETLYGHNSTLEVAVGDRVDGAMMIARSGSSGRSTGPHVHYEVLRPGTAGTAVVDVASAPAAPPAEIPARAWEADVRMQEIMQSIRDTVYHFDPVREPVSAVAEAPDDGSSS